MIFILKFQAQSKDYRYFQTCISIFKKLHSMSFSEKSSGGCIPPEKGANQGEKKKKRWRHRIHEVRGSNTMRGEGNSQEDSKGSSRKTTAAGAEQIISDWRKLQDVYLQEKNLKGPVSILTGFREWTIRLRCVL